MHRLALLVLLLASTAGAQSFDPSVLRPSVPRFTTAALLPPGIAGEAYSADIVTEGGDGARTLTIVGASLDPGLSVVDGRIRGTPASSRRSYLLARVNDADGDPRAELRFSTRRIGFHARGRDIPGRKPC